MKDFDLKYAKLGAAVCTRDGRKARIICYDRKGKNYTLIVLVMETYSEEYYSYTEQGTFEVDKNTKLDLMMRDDDYKERLERGEYDQPRQEPKQSGLSRREEFVKAAMQGLCANQFTIPASEEQADIARLAVEIADTTLKELERDPNEPRSITVDI